MNKSSKNNSQSLIDAIVTEVKLRKNEIKEHVNDSGFNTTSIIVSLTFIDYGFASADVCINKLTSNKILEDHFKTIFGDGSLSIDNMPNNERVLDVDNELSLNEYARSRIILLFTRIL